MDENKKQTSVPWKLVVFGSLGIVVAYFVALRIAAHLDASASAQDIAAASACAKQLMLDDIQRKGEPITNYAITRAEKRCEGLAEESTERETVAMQRTVLEKQER